MRVGGEQAERTGPRGDEIQMIDSDKEVAQRMERTHTVSLVVGCERLVEVIERFMQDEDLIEVFVRDQRRGRDSMLRVERWPKEHAKAWLRSYGPGWLRLRLEDLVASERYLSGGSWE